ncbi:unnamed protein product [Calicophoron daubneyi]|uniref:EF-hand domain-containing protein n=1 Tax=Calicophoron daubneyi TaxID=300641 RepID=A0AAV2TST6_CALDB
MKLEEINEIDMRKIMDAIKYFDGKEQGFIPTRSLGHLMRFLNLIPSNKEVEDLARRLDPHKTGKIENIFLPAAIAENWPASPNEILQRVWDAFTIFDPAQKGKITIDQFKNILLTIGEEPIPEQEVRNIIKEYGDLEHGVVEYSAVVHEWTS